MFLSDCCEFPSVPSLPEKKMMTVRVSMLLRLREYMTYSNLFPSWSDLGRISTRDIQSVPGGKVNFLGGHST